MNYSRRPIRNLTEQLTKHGAFRRRNIPKISAFYFKSILQAPFRLYERIRYERTIERHQLEKDPVFIIGHWRSGTSFLQYLLAQDPQFGYMNKFQVVFPDLFLSSERFLKSVVNIIPDSLNLIQDAQNMSINLELDSPSEIEIALTTMISPASLHWGNIFPNNAWEYFDKYLLFDSATKTEIERWRNDYRYLIKKTSLKNNGRQLLIKSPGNTSRTDKLLKEYPNARFIFIHRNPYDVFYSNQKLWKTLLNNLALQDFGKEQIEEAIFKVYEKVMRRYLQQRNSITENQLTEIRFEDFVTRPVRVLQNTYNQLHLEGFDKAKPRFKGFLDQKAEGKSSNYEYEDHIIEKINNYWKFAFEEWNYSIISSTKVSNIYN